METELQFDFEKGEWIIQEDRDHRINILNQNKKNGLMILTQKKLTKQIPYIWICLEEIQASTFLDLSNQVQSFSEKIIIQQLFFVVLKFMIR